VINQADGQPAEPEAALPASEGVELEPVRDAAPIPEPVLDSRADLAAAEISPDDDAKNRAVAKLLVDSVLALGVDAGWEPTDVMVRLKENKPFYMIATSPEEGGKSDLTIEVRQYRAEELADASFLNEIGMSQPTERYEDGSSLFLSESPERGSSAADLITGDLVISVQSEGLLSQDKAPVLSSVLADTTINVAKTAQVELSAG